jgi:hypothetical protein
MNDFWIKFLQGIGVSKETIDAMNKEEKPKDFDVNTHIDGYQSVQEKLFENKHKDRIIDKEALDKKFEVYRGTLAAKLNKQFDLGFTRKEIESMSFEEVLEKASVHVETKVSEASNNTDSELVKKNKLLQESVASAKNELDEYKSKFESEVSRIESEKQSELDEVKVDALFEKEWEKYTYAPEFAHLMPTIKKDIKQETKAKYKIATDGKLAGIDGTHAQDFDGKGIYDNLSQPVEYLLKKAKVVAKTQVIDENTPISVLAATPEKLSPAALNIFKAATANGK